MIYWMSTNLRYSTPVLVVVLAAVGYSLIALAMAVPAGVSGESLAGQTLAKAERGCHLPTDR